MEVSVGWNKQAIMIYSVKQQSLMIDQTFSDSVSKINFMFN